MCGFPLPAGRGGGSRAGTRRRGLGLVLRVSRCRRTGRDACGRRGPASCVGNGVIEVSGGDSSWRLARDGHGPAAGAARRLLLGRDGGYRLPGQADGADEENPEIACACRRCDSGPFLPPWPNRPKFVHGTSVDTLTKWDYPLTEALDRRPRRAGVPAPSGPAEHGDDFPWGACDIPVRGSQCGGSRAAVHRHPVAPAAVHPRRRPTRRLTRRRRSLFQEGDAGVVGRPSGSEARTWTGSSRRTCPAPGPAMLVTFRGAEPSRG